MDTLFRKQVAVQVLRVEVICLEERKEIYIFKSMNNKKVILDNYESFLFSLIYL